MNARTAARCAIKAVMAVEHIRRGGHAPASGSRQIVSGCRRAAVRAQKKEEFPMKKSTFVAVVAFFSAVAGALAAMFLYLRRREKELDEYESMLFSEEFTQEPEEARAIAHDEEDPAPNANCTDAL